MKIVLPVMSPTESGHVVYDGTRLLGFIRDDVHRGKLKEILGEHILLHPIRVPAGEFRRLCRMPGVGYVDR